jgi:HEAT repeat protein
VRSRPATLLVLALMLAGCAEESVSERYANDVIDDLVAREFGTASSRYRRYEAEVLAAEAAPVWRKAVEHGDSTVREWAVDALSRINLEGDFEIVRAALMDPARGVRTAAADGLARMDPQAATAEFLERLGSDLPDQVTLAANGLMNLGARPHVRQITERFLDPELPEATRSALTQSLAVLGDAGVVAVLVDAALDADLGTELRRLAAEAAFAVEAVDVDDELRRLLQADDEYIEALAGAMLDEG